VEQGSVRFAGGGAMLNLNMSSPELPDSRGFSVRKLVEWLKNLN
jgi:hypothetical protein